MPIKVEQLVVRHHPALAPVLAGVDLHVDAGEIVAVVGGNGSGKSTLARALAGILPIESGRISITGSSGGRVGLVLQDPAAQFIAGTVADDIAFGPEGAAWAPMRIVHRVDELVAALDLAEVAARDPARISGGQQQRSAIAAVLACDVDVLILDEPTALLDARARDAIVRGMRALAAERGVLWITQEADELAWCDRVIVMDAGIVIWSGSTHAYVADPSIAATVELELPVASRLAWGLTRAGEWNPSTPIPLTDAELLTAVGAIGNRELHGD